MAKQSSNEREKDERRRRRFWNCAQLVVGAWIKNRFGFSFDESFEPADIDGPVLVVINHASAYDPIFVGRAFRNKPLTFIASEHILRSKWGPFLEKNISFIPHSKGAKGSRTALVAMKRMKKGESIFLAAEGEQTWNGRPLPVMPYTGKLVRGSGATLVTYLLEGAYLSAPRWALHARRGRVYGRPAGVYGPEALKKMTDEEVEQLIARDLGFDTWEWQKSLPDGPVRYRCSKGGSADGLERDVFTCPSCGAFGTLRSDGDRIGCSCGFSVRMADTGFFEESSPFETVADWEDADRAVLKRKIGSLSGGETGRAERTGGQGSAERDGETERAERDEEAERAERDGETGRAAGEDVVFADDGVVLHRIEDGHSDEEAARGRLTLSFSDGRFTLSIGGFSFDPAGITSMTMVLANRIVFSDKSGYYELLADKENRTNLRKYVIARDLILGG